jgi:hypothetical protein
MDAHSRSSTPRVKKSKHCNWLAELDKAMEVLWDRVTWSNIGYEGCPLFIMTRYPKLGFSPRIFIDADAKHFEERISEDPITRCITNELGSHEWEQLAALLLDTIDALKSYNAARRSARQVNKLAREPGRVRLLNGKIKKARAALQKLADYAKPLDLPKVSWVTDACLKKLSFLEIGDHTPGFYKSIKARYPMPKDPVSRCMVQLYWFFQYGCGLEGREAEVRVGLIRNAFWKELGVSEVPVRPKYGTGESRGCNAVHAAVLRFKEGTSLSINR